MHTKLVPQLVAQQGGYDAIVVDFYWVGEFTKAGWLQPLDDRIEGQGRHLRLRPGLMDLVGKVDGVTYMLPFYNYAMGLIYRKDLLEDPKNKPAFKAKYGMDLKVPTDLGRVPEAGGFFTRGRHPGLGHGQPGPQARPDRDGVVELPLRQWRPCITTSDWKARLTTDAGREGARGLQDQHREIRPGRRRELQLRRGVQRAGPGPRLQLHHLQLLPRRRTTIPKSRQWSARWRSSVPAQPEAAA